MGAIVSRWKAKATTVEVLEGIDKDIQTLEEHRENNKKRLKLWVYRLLLHSTLLYLIACIVVYVWYIPQRLMGKLILASLFLIFPLLVWLTRKLLITLYSRRTAKNDEKLEELKAEKKKILEQVMETETYKNAKLILERFDPDSKRNHEMESTPVRPPVTPRQGQELRQRHVTPRGPVVGTPNPAAARPPSGPAALAAPPALISGPGGPPERTLSSAAAHHNLTRRPATHTGTPLPGMGMQKSISEGETLKQLGYSSSRPQYATTVNQELETEATVGTCSPKFSVSFSDIKVDGSEFGVNNMDSSSLVSTIQTEDGMHPPGPPLVRPILPRERGAMDRVLEYLVGDGPQNRYALICQQCLSHNGMALKEEFEYIAFRCAYCYFLNPARKTRPQAPRLPELSHEGKANFGPSAMETDQSGTSSAPAEGKSEACGPVEEAEPRELKTTEELEKLKVPETNTSLSDVSEKLDSEQDVSAMEVE